MLKGLKLYSCAIAGVGNDTINPVFSRVSWVAVGKFRKSLGQNCAKKRGVARKVHRSLQKCEYLSTFAS